MPGDRMAEEYQAEIARLSREWDSLKAKLKAAPTDAERKSIRHQLVTVKQGRGQLRRTLAYMQSLDRFLTRGRRLQIERGDESFLGIDGERFWLD